MKWFLARMYPAVCLLGVVAGCSDSKTGTVTGIVTVDGKPMGGWEVGFVHEETDQRALGYARAGGKYEMFRGRGHERILTGSYKVSVSATEYADGCPLPTVKVKENVFSKIVNPGQNVIDLPLESVSR